MRSAPLLFAAILLCLAPLRLAAQDELCRLAAMHGASGYEQPVIDYLRQRLGEKAEVDNTGSLRITYGSGDPHTLLIAGIDEPGYVVSGMTDDGFLRLQRLADPAPHYQFDGFFQGWPVQITTRGGKLVPGVVAAPSVHFDSHSSSGSSVESLFVDLGAAGSSEVRAAGIGILDAVTLDKQCVVLGEGREVTAPWISSRASAAILLRLADLLVGKPPAATVTLAFVARQYYYNAGLLRVLQSVPADQVVLFRPTGNETTAIGAASGTVSDFSRQLLERAQALGLEARRSDSPSLPVGPFGPEKIWRDSQRVAIISPAVRYSGTPVEIVDQSELDGLARLLADVVGVPWQDPPRSRASQAGGPANSGERAASSLSPFAFLIEQLCEIYGVSGSEHAVRAWIQKQLPAWTQQRSTVDAKGNLIVRLGRDQPPRAVFIAHMDEIGFEVTADGADRYLTAESRGGGMADLFAWHPFWVHSGSRQWPAVMTRHGSLDIGAAPQDGSPRVAAGDTATVRKQFRLLLGNRVTARSLDDRVGCAVLLSALRSLDATRVRRLKEGPAVWFVFSVQEESGLVGARFVAQQVAASDDAAGGRAPRRVYAVDSFVTSDSPLESKRLANARLGEGFVIRAIDSSGITPRDAIERVIDLASRKQIPYQLGVTAGGNDGSTFVPHGAVNIPLSFPLRYAHSPGEVADLRDAEALRLIVAALLEAELEGKEDLPAAK